jgi:hypothetical protein
MRMKMPGGWKHPKPPGMRFGDRTLEQAEHDGSNKRECDIRDDDG